jgi:flagellin FlaB
MKIVTSEKGVIEMKELLKKLQRQKRGIVGLEAAIVLIAFVIIAAAFSFMVVNQGLFATERGKAVVQEGLDQASTPLTMDGSIFVRTTSSGQDVNCIVIPLRAFGVDYVAIWKNETVVTMKVDQKAWGNVYGGILYDSTNTNNTYDPTGHQFDDFVGVTLTGQKWANGTYNEGTMTTVAVLAIENSNGDEALNSEEKGYLIISLDSGDVAPVRQRVVVEIRLEKSAPLSIELNIPESLYVSTWHMV